MSECRWSEGLSGSYCQTHFAYTEDMGVCHVADLIARAEKAEAALQRAPLSLQTTIGGLSQRLWKAEQTLEQVRKLHRESTACPGDCSACGMAWPCATAAILDGGEA